MNEPDDHAELNRLVSGELPDKEALALMRRMLRDDDLRQTYTRLEAVDDLVRTAYLSQRAPSQTDATDAAAAAEEEDEDAEPEPVSGGAGQASPETGVGVRHDRRLRIAAILEEIDGSTPLRRRRRIPRRAVGWARSSRALPWTLAASLAVTCSLLFHLFPGAGGADTQVRRMDTRQAAFYNNVRRELGDTSMAVIWTHDGVSEVGDLSKAASPLKAEVILRATIVRTQEGAEPLQWSVDALMRRSQTVELVTQADRLWPASVRVSVAPDQGTLIPVNVQARLTQDPPVEIKCQKLLVTPSEPMSVGSVTAGSCRYELFIEATEAGAAPVEQ